MHRRDEAKEKDSGGRDKRRSGRLNEGGGLEVLILD